VCVHVYVCVCVVVSWVCDVVRMCVVSCVIFNVCECVCACTWACERTRTRACAKMEVYSSCLRVCGVCQGFILRRCVCVCVCVCMCVYVRVFVYVCVLGRCTLCSVGVLVVFVACLGCV